MRRRCTSPRPCHPQACAQGRRERQQGCHQGVPGLRFYISSAGPAVGASCRAAIHPHHSLQARGSTHPAFRALRVRDLKRRPLRPCPQRILPT